MDLDKFEIRIRNWLIICFFLIADIVFLMLLFDNVLLPNLKFIKWPGSWDFLGFCGAIIGGFLTLFGVRQTIKAQNRKDVLDRYPEKLLLSDDAYRILTPFVESLSAFVRVKNVEQLLEVEGILDEFLENDFGELKKISSKISGNCYELIMRIEMKLEIYYSMLDELKQGSIESEEFINSYYDWFSYIEAIVFEFQCETVEISDEYFKHFKK